VTDAPAPAPAPAPTTASASGASTTASDLLTVLERYYDAAPRPLATTEELGGFTLFLKRDPAGWPYYARPRLGSTETSTAAGVAAVRARQRELGVPETLEWVHETTPSLLAAARADGLTVHQCPLLVLGDATPEPTPPAGGRVAVLGADSPDLAAVDAAVHAGFSGVDEVDQEGTGANDDPGAASAWKSGLLADGLLVTAGAFDEAGRAVGGGSHAPRDDTTELAGIAVLPRARRRGLGAALAHALVADARARGIGTVFLSAQDDAVARVYQRVGFVRVGTACVAEPS
jgi:ribosomal protein S18 acetylase RimI-like enzyme